MAFVLETWCITVMFPKFQMPYEILESCTVSYYSRIDVAKGADRMTTIVQPMYAQCLYCQITSNSANNSVFLMYMYTELMQQHTMVAGVEEKAFSKCRTHCLGSVLQGFFLNFSDQFKKIIKRYKRLGYNMDIMRHSACLVVNLITVDSYGFLFNCTNVGQSSDLKTALA